MRIRFGPNDEDAAFSARKALVQQFRDWLAARPAYHDADPWDADFLLQWKWGYGDGDYGTWTRDEIDEFLLVHAPRKLGASSGDAASIPTSIGAFMYFLRDSKLLAKRSDPAESIASRALAQKQTFLDAMDDPANFSMGKRILTAAGVDVDEDLDQAALDDVMAQFNALSFEERGRILGLDDDAPDPEPEEHLPALPMRAVPSAAELDAIARASVLLRQVDALHAALGPAGVKLTKAGNLSVADGKRFVDLVGTNDRIEGLRSSAHLVELFSVGQIAIEAGAVEVSVSGNRMQAAEGWRRESDAQRWQRVVRAALDVGVATFHLGAFVPPPLLLHELADVMAIHFLAMLWLSGETITPDVFVDILEEAAEMEPPARALDRLGPDFRAEICGSRIDDVITTLESSGVVEVVDDGVKIIDAGAWAVGPTLAAFGFDVLTADDIPDLDAHGLIDLLRERDENAEIIVPIWVADRDPAMLAETVVATLVEDAEPMRVALGFHVLTQLGPAAIDAVSAARDTAISAQAWLFLSDVGVVDRDDVPREAMIQAGIEHFATLSEMGSPADVVEILIGNGGGKIDDPMGLIDEFAASDDPRVGELLELLGRHLPDKTLAKHARKAAHRWRTSRGAHRG